MGKIKQKGQRILIFSYKINLAINKVQAKFEDIEAEISVL